MRKRKEWKRKGRNAFIRHPIKKFPNQRLRTRQQSASVSGNVQKRLKIPNLFRKMLHSKMSVGFSKRIIGRVVRYRSSVDFSDSSLIVGISIIVLLGKKSGLWRINSPFSSPAPYLLFEGWEFVTTHLFNTSPT